MQGTQTRTGALLALALLALSAVFAAVPVAHASAEPAYCSTIGGSWDGVSTCTFSSDVGYLADIGTFTVTSGTTLVIASYGGLDVAVPFTNYGSIEIQNAACGSCSTIGLYVEFTQFYNYGTVLVQNSAYDGIDLHVSNMYNEVGAVLNVQNSCSGCGFSNGVVVESFGAGSTLTNYGTIFLSSTTTSINIQTGGVVTNYGYIDNTNGGSGFANTGAFYEECGSDYSGTFPSGTTYTYACGPVYLSIEQSLTSIQTTLSGLSLSGLTSDFATLQTDLKGNFTSLSGSTSTLTSDLSTDYSALSGTLSTLSTSVTDGFATVESDLGGISTQLTTIQSELSNLRSTPQLVANSGASTLTPLSATSTIYTSPSNKVGSVTVTLNTAGVAYRDGVTIRIYTNPSDPSFYVQQLVTYGGDTQMFTTSAAGWKVQIVASFYSAGTITVNWAYSALLPPPLPPPP